MLRSITLATAFVICLVAAQSRCFADQHDCENPTTTAAMRACENTRYEEANRKLNEVYSQVLNSLTGDRKEKLRSAESAWIIFRNKNADFLASGAEGGTLAPLLRVSALADTTEQRLKELTKLAKSK